MCISVTNSNTIGKHENNRGKSSELLFREKLKNIYSSNYKYTGEFEILNFLNTLFKIDVVNDVEEGIIMHVSNTSVS